MKIYMETNPPSASQPASYRGISVKINYSLIYYQFLRKPDSLVLHLMKFITILILLV